MANEFYGMFDSYEIVDDEKKDDYNVFLKLIYKNRLPFLLSVFYTKMELLSLD